MIILTTCRRPTQRIRSFIKDISNSHPATTLLTRGKLDLLNLATTARKSKSDHLMVVSRWMGGPGKMGILKVDSDHASPLVALHLKRVKLRREYGSGRAPKAQIVTVSKDARPETIKFARWYSNLLGMEPRDSGNHAGHKASIHISDDPHTIRVALTSPPTEFEVGPSFTISRIDWDPVETA